MRQIDIVRLTLEIYVALIYNTNSFFCKSLEDMGMILVSILLCLYIITNHTET